MTWNYRIIQGKDHLGIYEVYYNEKKEINGYTEDPILVANLDEGRESLINQLNMILRDIRGHAPILIESEIKLVDWPELEEEGTEGL